MFQIPIELLTEKAENLGICLEKESVIGLSKYADLLFETNKIMNLTAITDEREMVMKHFVDCLSIFSVMDIPQNAKIIDVGTGAGFPGVVLKIVRPDIQLTLLDSTKKKLSFIENVLSNVSLTAEFLPLRAEQAGQNKLYREQYDFATARAVANLRDLTEFCLPFVKVGGYFLSMKGSKAQEEIEDAKYAIKILGGTVESVHPFTLEEYGQRNIIVIKKISHTSPKYPRNNAQISKNPLNNR